MDYFASLGKPETDPLRIRMRQQQGVCVKAVAARNAAVERKEDPAVITDLREQAAAAQRSYSLLLEELVARPYMRASAAEPEPDEPEPMIDEDED